MFVMALCHLFSSMYAREGSAEQNDCSIRSLSKLFLRSFARVMNDMDCDDNLFSFATVALLAQYFKARTEHASLQYSFQNLKNFEVSNTFLSLLAGSDKCSVMSLLIFTKKCGKDLDSRIKLQKTEARYIWTIYFFKC